MPSSDSQATQELLVEILTEELPALPFLKEWHNLKQKWQQALAQVHIQAPCELHYTPRRITIYSRAFPTHTTAQTQEFYGPPLEIAFINGDRAQGLSKAGLGFCKKAGVDSTFSGDCLDSRVSRETSAQPKQYPLFCDEKYGLQEKSQGSCLSGNDCSDFSPLSHLSHKTSEAVQEQAQAGLFSKAKSFLQVAEKDGKQVLYVRKLQAGLESKQVLAEVVATFVRSLHFGKSMRWGEVEESFIRPIRNIMILLDGESITTEADSKMFGQNSLAATLLHRSYKPKAHDLLESNVDNTALAQEAWVKITGLDAYLDKLKNGGVILSADERKERILAQIGVIESTHQVQVKLDSALLEQIVAITEYPTALLGSFEERFLTLPEEVITTSMKEHQKYFSVYKDGRLYQGFIVVANALCDDFSTIISGNERVLKARLSDAEFFYNNDIATPLDKAPLAQVAYIQGLGSMLDKVGREERVGAYLARLWGQDSGLITQALAYAKVDLLSEMVGEFPELQGIMGYYYALAQGFSQDLAQAIKEQYLPSGEDSVLPSNKISAIVALSGKLESLLGLFSLGTIPSGSKDPFALRRAANGVVKIVLEWDLAFDVKQILADLAKECGYAISQENLARLQDFIIERLESILDIPAQIFRSASRGLSTNLCTIASNAKALESLLARDDRETLIAVFKRVANITKDMQPSDLVAQSAQKLDSNDINALLGTINVSLLTQPEQALYTKLRAIDSAKHSGNLTHSSDRLAALFDLQDVLEEFFAKVLVNDEDLALRHNRKLLLYVIYAEFCTIGDLKELAI